MLKIVFHISAYINIYINTFVKIGVWGASIMQVYWVNCYYRNENKHNNIIFKYEHSEVW